MQWMRTKTAAQTGETRMSHIPSEKGQFSISVTPALDPIPINTMHSWTIHLETAAGEPLDGAQISISGGMPAHGHGLPTQPQVTSALGGGDYQVEGLRFQMPGSWQVSFHVLAGDIDDTATVSFMLR